MENTKINDIIEQAKGRILLYHLSGPLSFGAAKSMVRRLANYDEYDVLILDFTAVSLVDYTTTKSIHDMIGDVTKTSRQLYLVGMEGQVVELFERLVGLDSVKKDFQLSS